MRERILLYVYIIIYFFNMHIYLPNKRSSSISFTRRCECPIARKSITKLNNNPPNEPQ